MSTRTSLSGGGFAGTSLGPIGPSAQLRAIEQARSATVAAWRSAGPIRFSEQIVGGSRTLPKGNGSSVRFNGSTDIFAHGMFLGDASVAAGAVGTDSAQAWTAGDQIEYVAKVMVAGFASLGANALAGIELLGTAASVDGVFDKTTTTAKRITVGVDNAGDLFLVTSDGAAKTSVDTGINITSGTAFVLRVLFTKGTGVEIWVDGNAGTGGTLTLPDHIFMHAAGSGTAGVTGAHFGGFWEMTSA